VWRHALPNAGVPLVNVIAQNMIFALGGVIVVESVFGVPGVGSALIEAVGSGDMPMVQAIALVTGLAFVLIKPGLRCARRRAEPEAAWAQMTAAGGVTVESLMNADAAPAALLEEPEGAGRPALLRRVVRMRRGAVGVGMFAFILLVIVAGRWVAPYGSTVTGAGRSAPPPTGAHLLGTDELGRDIFSRVLSGGTFVLLVPLIANIIATLIGGGLGLWAAYVGGRVDQVISRIFDVMLSLPPILMVLVIIAGLGTSTTVILIAVAFFFIPRGGRVLRGGGTGRGLSRIRGCGRGTR